MAPLGGSTASVCSSSVGVEWPPCREGSPLVCVVHCIAPVEMEDAWSVQLPLCSADVASAYFAVFDGHGSRHFSHHCGRYLHEVIVENPDFCKPSPSYRLDFFPN